MQWNKENTDKLKTLVDDKKSARQIGDVLGVTKNSIIGKCRRMGFKLNSLVSCGPKRKRPVLKSDRMVLSSIKKHTDSYGWGLEFDEILEYSGLPAAIVVTSIRRLISEKSLNKTISNVADHVFFNDASVKQLGVPT